MPVLPPNDLRVNRRSIPLERLPAAFDGFTIAQVSDLHFYERTSPAYYERVAETVNALSPDIIALTGDVVHYGPDFVAAAGGFLSRLQAREARLAVLGNHDYNDGALGASVTRMLETAGFDLLINAHRRFERQGTSLWLAGLDDLWYGRPDIDQALDGVPADTDAVVMLAHNPLLFDPISMPARHRVDLVLAGHTHAGHVYIPCLGPIYRRVFRMKYRYGLFERNGCRMYVTSGLGSAAFYLKKRRIPFPRFRFNTRPEVAVLELRALPSSKEEPRPQNPR
jgi:predicted MPP superfamily phosphohydrolase